MSHTLILREVSCGERQLDERFRNRNRVIEIVATLLLHRKQRKGIKIINKADALYRIAHFVHLIVNVCGNSFLVAWFWRFRRIR